MINYAGFVVAERIFDIYENLDVVIEQNRCSCVSSADLS